MRSWSLHAYAALALVFSGCAGAVDEDGESPFIPPGQEPSVERRPVPSPSDRPEDANSDPSSYPTEHNVFDGLPAGALQLSELCARGGATRIHAVFCANPPPELRGLRDLQAAFELNAPDEFYARFALLGHSTSLVGRFVSAINPRVIHFSRRIREDYVFLGFVRGEQLVEMAAFDAVTREPAFFLLRFEQACNSSPEGCSMGDLLTPAIETDWTGYTIYGEEDVKNTVLDCRQCHQPLGPNSPKILRMQELRAPWTHWLSDLREGGGELLEDYAAAHGCDEPYAGIPGEALGEVCGGGANFGPFQLEGAMKSNLIASHEEHPLSGDQIHLYSRDLQRDLFDQRGPNYESWYALYDRFRAGEIIPPPYFDLRITDDAKLSAMSQAYRDYRDGTLPRDALPDIRDVMKDDDLWAMGFGIREQASGEEVLVSACAQCHNSRLDQSLSRARFSVDLEILSREQKDTAIERLLLPDDHLLKMPPERFRTLTDAQVARAIEVLSR